MWPAIPASGGLYELEKLKEIEGQFLPASQQMLVPSYLISYHKKAKPEKHNFGRQIAT